MKSRLLPILAVALMGTAAWAGPQDSSAFDGTRYAPQKALYDFNFAKPLEGKAAFGYIKNHLRAIKEYGDPARSHIVIVAHGNELHAFSRLNRAAYPDMYDELKALKDAGVTIRVCSNAARSRGYKPDEFYDVVTGLCERLLAGGAPGLHFYTLNQAGLTTEIWRRLNIEWQARNAESRFVPFSPGAKGQG